MARKPSPWYWPERNGWFTILNGHRHPLGEHPADLPTPQKRKGKWVVPQRSRRPSTLLVAPAPRPASHGGNAATAGMTVSEVLDKFLDWTEKHKAAADLRVVSRPPSELPESPRQSRMAVSDLRPFHVVEWVDKHPDWSPAYRRGGDRRRPAAVQLGRGTGLHHASPVKKIKKPQPQRRESHVTAEDFADLVAHYPEGDPLPRPAAVRLALRLPAAGGEPTSSPARPTSPRSASSSPRRRPRASGRPG